MKKLSKDISSALNNLIELMEYEVDMSEIEFSELKGYMDSKIKTFKSAKQILSKWQKSEEAPSDETVRKYIEKLVEVGDKSVLDLRQGLSKKLDFSKVSARVLSQVGPTKTLILDNIWTLDTEILDLKLQLDSEEDFRLDESDFKIGLPEKFSMGQFYPMSNYYKEWYNKEEDAVMLCPKGTKGKIMEIDGLKIQLPKVPPKKEILFSDLPKKEQYWRRTDMPKGLTPDNYEPYMNYIMEEFRRRREGIWFMNNGEPVYLTGDAYFCLQWCRMKDTGGFMAFRYSQLYNIFYFKQACLVDKRCLGEVFVKSRRTGYTYISLGCMLNEATSTKNNNYGMTSQSDADAKKAWMKMVYMFRSLPFFFRPVVKGTLDSPKKYEFAIPSNRTRKHKLKKEINDEDYLNNTLDYQPTKDGSYDGQSLRQYLGDEASKWKKPANYLRHWGRVSPTMNQTGRIVGKAWIGSTVNPMNEGGLEFRKLYNGADLKKRNAVGRTPNGLYGHFMPAHVNMEEFTDKYGVCHVTKPEKETYNVYGDLIDMGSKDFLEAQRQSALDSDEITYNEELRANPMTVAEAFRDSAQKVIFNLEKILEQYEYNQSDIVLGQVVTRGNFVWQHGVRDSNVVFQPDRQGRFLVTWLPPEQYRSKWKLQLGTKCPINSYGAFGCDPYDISGVVSGKGSNGALSGVTNNGQGIAPPHTFFLEYCTRISAEMFYEDVLMACVFYSLPVLIESNKSRILYYFRDRGYRGFSMNRPDKEWDKLSPDEKEVGGIPSNSESLKQDHAQAIQYYVDRYVGYERELDPTKRVREHGAMGTMYFQRTLDDWLHFDYEKRTKSDLTISSGYALMAAHKDKYTPKKSIQPVSISIFGSRGPRHREF